MPLLMGKKNNDHLTLKKNVIFSKPLFFKLTIFIIFGYNLADAQYNEGGICVLWIHYSADAQCQWYMYLFTV